MRLVVLTTIFLYDVHNTPCYLPDVDTGCFVSLAAYFSPDPPKTTNTEERRQSQHYLLHGIESLLEANRFSASQEIPRILWNPKVHYRIHKCPPPVPILSQLDPFHNPTFYFLKIHLNVVFPTTAGSLKWPLSLRFSHQNPEYASHITHTRYMPRPSHSPRLITRTILSEEYRSNPSINCRIYSHRLECKEIIPFCLPVLFILPVFHYFLLSLSFVSAIICV